ncbi:uncharacterized protein LOC114272864 [Camellia sinensis]|uniref:uncharacterized protein LOC114272864 n=1 Tax=Camellia sinensis TaxID=4442 RepID=UPI0010359330|nr:uncharacterized protein LOC114272864 [Camellia sinensis]
MRRFAVNFVPFSFAIYFHILQKFLSHPLVGSDDCTFVSSSSRHGPILAIYCYKYSLLCLAKGKFKITQLCLVQIMQAASLKFCFRIYYAWPRSNFIAIYHHEITAFNDELLHATFTLGFPFYRTKRKVVMDLKLLFNQLGDFNETRFVTTFWNNWVWSDILHLVEKRPALVEFYLSNLQLSVGNGGRIHFWEDKWFNNVCLKEEFPRLYSLSKEKDSTIQQIYQRRGQSYESGI